MRNNPLKTVKIHTVTDLHLLISN